MSNRNVENRSNDISCFCIDYIDQLNPNIINMVQIILSLKIMNFINQKFS